LKEHLNKKCWIIHKKNNNYITNTVSKQNNNNPSNNNGISNSNANKVNNAVNNNDNNAANKIINSGKDIIKLFIVLYLNYEELNENIKKEAKQNINQKYCIINKEFMRIYKEYYNYQNIINILLNEPNVKAEFLKYKNNINYCIKNKVNYDQFISPIIQQFKDGNVLELGQKKRKAR